MLAFVDVHCRSGPASSRDLTDCADKTTPNPQRKGIHNVKCGHMTRGSVKMSAVLILQMAGPLLGDRFVPERRLYIRGHQSLAGGFERIVSGGSIRLSH